MKKIILTVSLFLSLSFVIYTQDFVTNDFQLPLFLPLSTGSFALSSDQIYTMSPMAYSPDYSQSFGGKLGYGLLNSFFGLGSYLAGDLGWGIGLSVWQGLGFVGFLGFGWDKLLAGTFFDRFAEKADAAGEAALYSLAAGPAAFIVCLCFGAFLPLEAVLLISAISAVVVPMFTFFGHYEVYKKSTVEGGTDWEIFVFDWDMISLFIWGTGVIFGIFVPFIAKTSPDEQPTAQLDDLRNWEFGVVPAPNGRLAGRIAFTVHF